MSLMSHRRRILCVDLGSSSLKIAVWELGENYEQRLVDGGIDRLGAAGNTLRMTDHRESPARERPYPLDGATPIAALLAALAELDVPIDAVGHRVLYGGAAHEEPARVSATLMASLTELLPFDPLHLPGALAAIRETAAALPQIGQVVCFDTAFHHRMPPVAQRLPLPRELFSEGVRRYGFHGLSYESIVRELGPAGARGAMIMAHLGSGASLAATRNGRPVDTTMGFSALGGVMMATRPGDLDPGALLYLLRGARYTDKELDAVLNHHSGLLGVSQLSGDMRTLLDKRPTDGAAADAVELFVYTAKKHLGALVAVLGRLDTLVFTGGIGERSAPIRAEICAGLDHFGIELNAERNAADAGIISSDSSHVIVRVIAANENLMVARHTYAVLFAPGADRAPPPVLANAAAS
jgi:acetate kinase